MLNGFTYTLHMVSMCKVVKLGLNKMKFCSKTSKQNQNSMSTIQLFHTL